MDKADSNQQAGFRWFWIFAILLGGAILGAFLFWRSRSPFPMNVVLSDGTGIRILKMEYGRRMYVSGDPVEKIIALRLLGVIRPSAYPRPALYLPPKPVLLLVYNDLNPGRTNLLNFEIVDDEGVGIPAPLPQAYARGSRLGDPLTFVFFNYPRHSKSLKLRVYGIDYRGQSVSLAEVALQNSFQSEPERWPDQPLPAERVAGKLSVKMLDAIWNTNFVSTSPLTNSHSGHRLELQLELSEGQQRTTDWRPHSVSMDDASGNHLDSVDPFRGGVRIDETEGTVSMKLRNSLWPAEPIRYTLELYRTAHFASNEVWTTPPIALPPARGFTRLGLAKEWGGQTVVVEGIAGDSSIPSWPRGGSARGGVSLDITVPGMTPGTCLKILSVIDEQGQNLLAPGAPDAWFVEESGDSQIHVGLLSTTAKTATATFALQKTARVEFTAQPRRL